MSQGGVYMLKSTNLSSVVKFFSVAIYIFFKYVTSFWSEEYSVV